MVKMTKKNRPHSGWFPDKRDQPAQQVRVDCQPKTTQILLRHLVICTHSHNVSLNVHIEGEMEKGHAISRKYCWGCLGGRTCSNMGGLRIRKNNITSHIEVEPVCEDILKNISPNACILLFRGELKRVS